MIDATTYYLIHDDDEYPPTFIHFDSDGEIEKVLVSQHRFELTDEEGQEYESSNDEAEIVEALNKARLDNGLATVDEYGVTATDDEDLDPRFYISDCRDRDETPSWFIDGDFGTHYVSTDGWRGYTDVDHNDTWQAYASGWLTGYPDGSTSYKMTAADLHNALWEGELVVPFPVVWFFGVTSNVFSQTSDILIPAGREDEFTDWLVDVAGFEGEAVQHAFN